MKNLFRNILLFLIVIIVTINQNYIVDILAEAIKPAIKIVMVQKNINNREKPKVIITPQEELEVGDQVTEDKKEELALEAKPREELVKKTEIKEEAKEEIEKSKKNVNKYLTTKFRANGGCIENLLPFYKEGVTADHCFPDKQGKYNTRSYDSPVFSESREFLNLPKPELGNATMSVFRNKKPVEEEVVINKIEGCYAYYSINKGFSRVGDSGGRFWILVDGEKTLIGVNSRGDYKTIQEARENGPSSTGLFVFCKGLIPSPFN